MTQSTAVINTHQDLVHFSDVFNNVRVDKETGMISFNDVLYAVKSCINNKNKTFKNTIKKLPELQVVIKRINNKGNAIRLIHPSDVLKVLFCIRTKMVINLLTKKITNIFTTNIEQVLNSPDREDLMDSLNEPDLNIITQDISHILVGHYMYIFINIDTFNSVREIKIGRTSNLHKLINMYKRLTHRSELVFYRDCKTRACVVLAERVVFFKLDEYRVHLVHEQFRIPINGSMKNFINQINDSVNYLLNEKNTGVVNFLP